MSKYKCVDNPEHDKPWEQAVRTFNSGDKAGALFLFKRLALEGCSPALVEIGGIYEYGGGGVEKNIDKAVKWYLRSVEVQDDPIAHMGLGRIYLLNRRSEEDYVNAHYHFSLLASNEKRGALFALGYMFQYGLGVPKDQQQAIEYYKKASELGHVLAKRNLALILIRTSPFKGLISWFKASFLMNKIVLKDPTDARLTIR